MTRKRFIKLCMANGMQRNAANEQAKSVSMFGSYELMYQEIEESLPRLHTGTEIERVVMATMAAVRAFWESLVPALADICEGISNIFGNAAANLRGTSASYDDSKLKMAVDWIQMSNDDFYRLYGFNFNPHNYPGLYEAARTVVYGE
ncbi:MAG: hypothetical protein Q4F79_13160 [Eubacteriales bacterium]|nr:hypothetical protein [Eubacteriales bacterium]